MIIIKTGNGDQFVNEAEVIRVSHIKNHKMVHVYFARQCTPEQNPYVIIDDVEEVIYADKKWYKDEGSAVEELKKSLDNQERKNDDLRVQLTEVKKERNELADSLQNLKNSIKQNAAPNKITLRATSPIGSDCTQAFDVDGCDGMTAVDFIRDATNRCQLVTIDIMRDSKYVWHGEFRNGIIVEAKSKTVPVGIFSMTVQSANASGGWGQMSYNVKLYDSEDYTNNNIFDR